MNKPYFFNLNAAGNSNIPCYAHIHIDGDGHALSNIYTYQDQYIFKVRAEDTYYVCLHLKNITFEIINNGAWFFGGVTYGKLEMINCVFNCKTSLKTFDRTQNTAFSTKNFSSPVFVNCVFNIYISSSSSDNGCVMYLGGSNTDSSYSNKPIFESCEFKIRNNSGRTTVLFLTDYPGGRIVFDNCAIFYNDLTETEGHIVYFCGFLNGYAGRLDLSDGMIFSNSYFASFGNAPSVKPSIRVGGGIATDNFTTSFYDSDKVLCTNYDSTVLNVPSKFVPLTTAQCKNKNALTDIGYNFAEEI
jgi:hypothetical protein